MREPYNWSPPCEISSGSEKRQAAVCCSLSYRFMRLEDENIFCQVIRMKQRVRLLMFLQGVDHEVKCYGVDDCSDLRDA